MRVLIALDKMRGTFTAPAACALLARGMREAAPGILIDQLPLADGGEGTLDALVGPCTPRPRLTVRGPLGEPVEAEYGIAPDGAVVLESARFCGLALVPEALRDPLGATSAGLGEAIAACLDDGMRDFLIGLGGSATVDGGAGMARALGFRLIGEDGAPVSGAPRDLTRLGRIDDSGAHQAIPLARFRALADVENPLLGPAGAVAVYAPQKGATPASLPLLERGLERLAERLGDWRRIDPAALASLPGAGAGGGLGLGCRSFLGADLTPGAPFIMDRLGFAGRLAGADLVVTGEGSFDAQSLHGKAAARVLEAAAAAGRPAALVAGRWDGALPARRPAGLRVFTASDLPGGGGYLDGPGLVETGRRIAAWASARP